MILDDVEPWDAETIELNRIAAAIHQYDMHLRLADIYRDTGTGYDVAAQFYATEVLARLETLPTEYPASQRAYADYFKRGDLPEMP